ncbi:hypothetical protein [Streptomyces jeddahensis]|uniref:Uncharacterized protein n=1 Tax=Streptomyces jeddahensis TaxID=1716141 RepID=A0A177HN36_9ACTN|nr:hypothetical protein [Streptomyces jeddahensis]OAH12029.1 hypothetical protein STSP_46040 [Streptomyces jeddahensis]
MSTSSWSTIAQVRILDGSAPARDAVRTAITRSFETLEVPVGAAGAGAAARAEQPAGAAAERPSGVAAGRPVGAAADQPFGVETAGRRFSAGRAPLAPAGSGRATVELVGDVDAVDRVAAVLSAEFVTEHVFEDATTLTLLVHADEHRPGLHTGP